MASTFATTMNVPKMETDGGDRVGGADTLASAQPTSPTSLSDKRSASSPTEETLQVTPSPKRQKLAESSTTTLSSTTSTSSSSSVTIERSELDSALALASLALNSPKKSPVADQTRDATTDLSPKMTNTPEERARSEPAHVSPGTPVHTTPKRKRVHFSSQATTGAAERTSAMSPPSRLIRRRRPMMVPSQRKLPFVPGAKTAGGNGGPIPLPPPGLPHYRRGLPPPPLPPNHPHSMMLPMIPPYPPTSGSRAPPPPHARHRHLHHPPPPPPSLHHHMMYRQWMNAMNHHANRVPPSPRQQHLQMLETTANNSKANNNNNNSSNCQTWVCDFCNSATFRTYEETCLHEQVCPRRPSLYHAQGAVRMAADRQDEETARGDDDEAAQDICDDANQPASWFAGSVSLAVEPADKEWLSELNCFVRQQCVEAFSATELDVIKTSKRGRIMEKQVGIRCRFCVHRHFKDKAVAAVSYPTSMAGIYESVKRWQRVHLQACMDVPDDVQHQLDKLQADTVWVPTTRQYWTDSARALGMKDTSCGIRFERDPAIPPSSDWSPEATSKTDLETAAAASATPATGGRAQSSVSQFEDAPAEASSSYASYIDRPQESGGFICYPEDIEMIPPYVHFLMRQVEPCYFTEADRFVARSKGPVGFAGFQCRHCNGHAGLGKYFPLTPKALSTNSTSQNIHAHLLKCRKSNQGIKDELIRLKTEKLKSPRLVPGWRKTFFDMVWGRLHGDNVNLN